METYHIHIRGLVQGLGFRSFICRLAADMDLKGWVSNTGNGVHIECNATRTIAMDFCNRLLSQPPPHSIITHYDIEKTKHQDYTSFSIRESSDDTISDLLLTPDRALCDKCSKELNDEHNRRYQYAFTTCPECGPRYSISKAFPYHRDNTTMSEMHLCKHCLQEYNDIHNSRYYSQTNSCTHCSIPMHLYKAPHEYISSDSRLILLTINNALEAGDTVAVKDIGGYLLLCDATNGDAIQMLRRRKRRSYKPFALLYVDVAMAQKDVLIRPVEKTALTNTVAPIVLCRLKERSGNGICTSVIAPGLNKIGVMLPCSPLLMLIAQNFKRPLVVTGGNINGSPVLYKDEDALDVLSGMADYILTYDRDVVIPQNDSIMQFTEKEQSVLLRRSRGLAPNYFPVPFNMHDKVLLAMGADPKNAFALLNNHKLYISQYLGNLHNEASQTAFKDTLQHLLQLLKVTPGHIITDKHPGYFVTQEAEALAATSGALLTSVQHHKAHFAAVLAENNLLRSKEPVLGVIWDGAGYGDDKQVWGGEVFVFEDRHLINRVAHLDYFSQFAGDKMIREPRLSAFALLKYFPAQQNLLKKFFTEKEWSMNQQLINQPHPLLTSSMGRLLDGIATILGLVQYNTWDAEAAMQLEALAARCTDKTTGYYHIPLINGCMQWEELMAGLLQDVEQKVQPPAIAWKLFYSLAMAVLKLSDHFETSRIAFSGGVFQNALLTDMIIELASGKKQLYFHRQLSPNDECIAFGQLAYYSLYKHCMNESRINQTEKDIIK